MTKIKAHDMPTWWDILVALLLFFALSGFMAYFTHLDRKMKEADRPSVEKVVEKAVEKTVEKDIESK
jgi:hypothetical protein